MNKIVKDCFTDSSGEYWEFASILGATAFLAFLIFSAYHYLWLKTPFDPIAFGTGSMAIAGGTGAHKLFSSKADADAHD